jgi:hypothetical protein
MSDIAEMEKFTQYFNLTITTTVYIAIYITSTPCGLNKTYKQVKK